MITQLHKCFKSYKDNIELKTQNKQKIQEKQKHEKIVFQKIR